jgi:hypothetical protein
MRMSRNDTKLDPDDCEYFRLQYNVKIEKLDQVISVNA